MGCSVVEGEFRPVSRVTSEIKIQLVTWDWILREGELEGEAIVLEELEVVGAVGDKGRFGAKVYGVEVLRLGKPIFWSSTYLGR